MRFSKLIGLKMSGSVTQNPKGEDGSIEHIALNDDVKENDEMF